MDQVVRRLLDLPNGPNFTKITLLCVDNEIDFKSATDLVSKCSDSLESLDVSGYLSGGFFHSPCLIDALSLHSDLSTPGSFNLSTATKLKYLVFQCGRPTVQ